MTAASFSRSSTGEGLRNPAGDQALQPVADRSAAAEETLRQSALAWLDAHGGEPLPWTALTGESAAAHARGVDSILQAQGADLVTRLVGILACSRPAPEDQDLVDCVGPELAVQMAGLLENSIRLLALSLGPVDDSLQAGRHQAETLRRMTMTMARDVRVVMVRLASGLQSLRRLVADGLAGKDAARGPAHEALTVLAPLANRLGLFRLKWEMEDLAFRCSQPEVYRSLARQLESKRIERESFVAGVARELATMLRERGIRATVTGRPKHLYSIHNKLQSKQLTLDGLHDLRGLRVLVETLADCYAALDVVHQRWAPEPKEFDDYIAKPKPNGYRSLHTVVLADDGRTLEVQIRTRDMHEQAEYGVAAHWRYKERTAPGTAGAAGAGGGDAAAGKGGAAGADADQAARLAWLRQLLAWQQDVGMRLGAEEARTSDDSRIFVMTPQGRVIELPAGSTPVDFAYHVHSTLGHRCRGAKVDGRMVPLNTGLANGQVVEIIGARGPGTRAVAPGPSRDWLNPALGYIRSHRARAKVRQWFNAQQHDAEIAAGRERVEKTLAREGRTLLSLDELAARLGRSSTAEMFAEVARDLIGARALEEAIRSFSAPAAAPASKPQEPGAALPLGAAGRQAGPMRSAGDAVLVVGVDFLLTQLARCCHPVPPDPITGFVTRGKGVTIHRGNCPSLRQIAHRSPERVLPASWGDWERPARSKRGEPAVRRYPAAVQINASDRSGLLRDLTEVFARERINVLSVRSNTRTDQARFNFIIEVPSAIALERVLGILREIRGVENCSRG